MPFALLVVGITLLTAGVRGTQGTLFSLIQGDFSGSDNFVYWFVAIILVGLLGYVPKLKYLSWAFLALILVVLLLSHNGFFGKLTSALGTTNTSQQQNAVTQGLQSAIANTLSPVPGGDTPDNILGVQPVGTYPIATTSIGSL